MIIKRITNIVVIKIIGMQKYLNLSYDNNCYDNNCYDDNQNINRIYKYAY